jgi:hypothetical protein
MSQELDTQSAKEKRHKSLLLMALQVRPQGLEPPTLGSEVGVGRPASQHRNGYVAKHYSDCADDCKPVHTTAFPRDFSW